MESNRRVRGPMIAFAIAAVIGMASFVLAPMAAYGAGGYPGPDALPGVPTYGNYLGSIPAGHHSALSWVCGLDAPNATNQSPRYASAFINGRLVAFLPISTQYGCASFTLFVSLVNGKHQLARCGYVYVSINGGPWKLEHEGHNTLFITGIKHYHHVGAIFPFFIPKPKSTADYCPTVTTTTRPGHVFPTTTTPTTIPNQTTTIALHPTSTTLPGFRPTTSIFNAGSTTKPTHPGGTPTGALKKVAKIATLITVVAAAGAAAASAGGFVPGVPESLVEEYTTEIVAGGGLPFQLFPAAGAGSLALIPDNVIVPLFSSWTQVDTGGGYPFGGEVPNGGSSDAFTGQQVVRGPEQEELLFAPGPSTTPTGGGAPMSGLTGHSGGVGFDGAEPTSGG